MATEISRREYQERQELMKRIRPLPGQVFPQKFEFNPKGARLEIMDLNDFGENPMADVPYAEENGVRVYDLNNI